MNGLPVSGIPSISRVSFSFLQPAFSPAAWTPVMRPCSLPLGARLLETNQRIAVIKSPPTRPDSASSQTQRMRVMGPRTPFMSLLWTLVLTETLSGECGVGRERPLRGGARGPPGTLGAGPQEGATLMSLPRNFSRVPACPSLASRPLFSTPFEVRTGFRPLQSHWPYTPLPSWPHHLGPGTRAGGGCRAGSHSPRPQAPTP